MGIDIEDGAWRSSIIAHLTADRKPITSIKESQQLMLALGKVFDMEHIVQHYVDENDPIRVICNENLPAALKPIENIQPTLQL